MVEEVKQSPEEEGEPDIVSLAGQQALQLENEKSVLFRCEGRDPAQYCRFYFDVEEPCIVKVSTWTVQGDSNPSLFVDIDNENVNTTNNLFRSSKNGPNHVTVCPQDRQFELNVWNVAIKA